MPWSKAGNLCGPTAVSTDAGNSSRLGSDGLLFTPAGDYLPLAGGSLTGALNLAANPSAPLEAATKQYVDSRVVVTAAGAAAPSTAELSDGTLWLEV